MDSLQIRLSGSGGQGLQLGARILAQALSAQGYAVAQSQAYEPTSRGGLSRSDIVASPDAVDYPLVTALDVLVVLDTIAARGSDDIVNESTLVLVDGGRVETPAKAVGVYWSLPLVQSAREVGEPRGANMVALGALSVLSAALAPDPLRHAIESSLGRARRDINLRAFEAGREIAEAAGA